MDMISLTYWGFLSLDNEQIYPLSTTVPVALVTSNYNNWEFYKFNRFQSFDTITSFYFKITNKIGKTYSIIFSFFEKETEARKELVNDLMYSQY